MLFKDNENLPLAPMLDPVDPDPGPQPFEHAQMVACDECLRTSPPTRVNCLYCGAVLPQSESTLDLQKPTLRPLEKWELGYNNILVPSSANDPAQTEVDLDTAAGVLKLAASELGRVLSTNMPLPVARAATIDEATLVQRRLRDLSIETQVVSDAELGFTEMGPIRVRTIDMSDEGLSLWHSREAKPDSIGWQDLLLVVTGRLVSSRIELSEEMGKRAENRIVDSSQFFSDEVVFEIYANNSQGPFRIAANSFDFSCLAERKGLISVENMNTLLDIFITRAPDVKVDRSYQSLRKVIEPVWPVEQQNESAGWRRERPGKITVGSVSVKNNEMQFARYSLLRHYLYLQSARLA